MNAFEKFVVEEMVSQAEMLVGCEYGDEVDCIFGNDLEAGSYIYQRCNCINFVNTYLCDLQKAVNKYNITTSYEDNHELFIIECIYNTAFDIVDRMNTAAFRGKRYQTEKDIEEFRSDLYKMMEVLTL